MTKTELFELIKKHSINYTSEWILRDAVEEYSSASNGAKPIVSGSLLLDYWKRRCALAEECLEKSPCDPDITKEQIEAWAAYHSFIKEFGNDS